MKLHAIIAASALAISGTATFAQSPPPADPNTKQNVQPAPSTTNPADPAASANPSAAAPTAPPAATGNGSAGSGASTGESGSSAPAGIPADPNTKQNVQPGPSTMTPADPAAGNNPDARAPTAP